MDRRTLLFALALAAIFSAARAEQPTSSTGTDSSERPTGGLKAMKNASRRDPSAMALELTSPEARDRGQAAQALGQLGTSAESATKALTEALTDFAAYRGEDGNTHIVAVEASQALRQVNPKVALTSRTLMRLARAASASPEHQLVQGGWVSRCGAQAEALATLSALGPLAQPVLPEILRLNRKPCSQGQAFEAAQAIGPLTQDQMPRLDALLADPDADARRSVADYIGAFHVAVGAAALGRAMNDSSSGVRLSALEALEKIHPEGEGRVPLVKPFLQDDSPEIRRQALRFLMQLSPQSPTTLALLKERLADPDASLVMESAQAISRAQPRNPQLLEALIRLAKGIDTETGSQAAELLKSSGSRDPKVVEALEPYLEREREERLEKAVLSSTPEERDANGRTLRVNAIRIAKGIKGELPDRPGHLFGVKSGRLYCWTTVSARATPASLRHVWYFEGHPIHETTLVVPDPSSRVWSSLRIRPGKWRVDVLAPGSDEPLAAAAFTVVKD
jgi:HEAT repeat protein